MNSENKEAILHAVDASYINVYRDVGLAVRDNVEMSIWYHVALDTWSSVCRNVMTEVSNVIRVEGYFGHGRTEIRQRNENGS